LAVADQFETGHNGFACEVNNVRFADPEFFAIGIRSNENDAIVLDRDCLGGRLVFVNGVDISVNENCLRGFRASSDAAHKQQDNSDSSHHRTPLSFWAKMPVRLGLKIFFAKQWRVYRISAHCFGSACNLNHLLI